MNLSNIKLLIKAIATPIILSMILMKQDNPYKDEWKKVAIVCVVMFVIFAVFGGLISLLYSLMFFWYGSD